MENTNLINNETYKHYIYDLGLLIKNDAIEIRNDLKASKFKNTDYDKGRLMAYCEVLSLMQHQADVFDIPLEDLRLENFDPENDLLSDTNED